MKVRLELYLHGHLAKVKTIELFSGEGYSNENAYSLRQLQVENECNLFRLKYMKLIVEANEDFFIEPVFLSALNEMDIPDHEMDEFNLIIKNARYERIANTSGN